MVSPELGGLQRLVPQLARSRGKEGQKQFEKSSHLEECVGYEHLWEDKEITKYFIRLMKVRKDMMRKRN